MKDLKSNIKELNALIDSNARFLDKMEELHKKWDAENSLLLKEYKRVHGKLRVIK